MQLDEAIYAALMADRSATGHIVNDQEDRFDAALRHCDRSMTPLLQATSAVHFELVHNLLDAGADVDAMNIVEEGCMTTLQCMCIDRMHADNVESTRVLIVRGADLGAPLVVIRRAVTLRCSTGGAPGVWSGTF